MARTWWGDGPAPVFARRDVPLGRAQQRARFDALAAYRQQWPPSSDDGLGAFELSVCSQNGEDGVLAEILRRTGTPTRTFVEFGVEDGSEGNCVLLADHLAWAGTFLESDDGAFRRLAAKYAWNERVRTEHARITAAGVDGVFSTAGVPAEVDVLSIDIDGADLAVWAALSVTRAQVVVIEYNSALDPAVPLVPRTGDRPWDGTQNHGSSLAAVLTVAEKKGYDLVHLESAGVNAFLVDRACGWDGLSGDAVTRRTPNYFGLRAGHPGADPSLTAFRPPSGRSIEW